VTEGADPTLAGQISRFVDQVSFSAALQVASDLASVESALSARAASVAGKYETSSLRASTASLVDAWNKECPDLPGAGLGLAIRAAAIARQEERGEQRIEPVWSGPDTPEIAVRNTREALVEVIQGARRRLIVVSFAAYKVQAVLAALRAAAERGVDVRLVLETIEDSEGFLTIDAAAAFGDLKGRATFWVWPGDRRPPNAKLHAKAALADGRAALVGSANLTEVALGDSMELGLLIRGGPIPRRLDGHFMALMERGELRQSPTA
jgi:phosphatidylserine/phosphatidylglycerophosphate/cardiolipin synthase-like enzyme